MDTWTPFTPDSGFGRPSIVDRVTALRSGSIRLSEDISQKLGSPKRIQLLTNGQRDRFGVRAAKDPSGSVSLSQAGRQREFRIGQLCTAIGKDPSRITWPLELPHTWEEHVLVIDVSQIPDVERT